MARGKYKKCSVKTKSKSPRKCDSDESSPDKRFEDSGPKKRGRPSRSHQNQNVSCSTPGIFDEESSPDKRFEDSGPKKRGRPSRSYQNQNVSTPGILDEENSPNKKFEDSGLKKRGRPSRSYQNQNVSCSTPGILDEESVPKKRGRPRSCQTQNVLGSAIKIIHQENNAELRSGRKRKNESGGNQDSTEDVISKKRVRTQGITKGKQKQAEVQYVNCDLISEEDNWQENIETGSAENDDSLEDLIMDPLNSFQNVKKCEIPMERKYEIKEEEEEIMDNDIQNDFENEVPTGNSHLNWPRVIVFRCNEKPVPTSSAAIDNINVETGDFAVNENLSTSEAGEHALPDCVLPSSDVFCNINGPFEDSTDHSDLRTFELTGGGLLVPVLCNNENPIPTSSAAIDNINVETGDFAVNENISTSEAGEHALPDCVLPSSDVFCNINGPFEDSTDHSDLRTFELTGGGLLVPVLCNNEKPIPTSSAAIGGLNIGIGDFTVDESKRASEARKHALPTSVLLNYEDPISTSSDDLCNSNGPIDDSSDHDVDVETFEVTEDGLLVPFLCNNDKAVSNASANNCNINGGCGGFAVNQNLSVSEAGENILPVSLHSDGISQYEDSVIEAMVAGALQGLNRDKDKLGACKGLVDGIRLFVKIQKKDPTILTLSACFSTEKLYIVLDTIKEMFENYEQFVSNDSFIESLSWFFTTAGTEVIKEAIRNSKSEEEKNTKIRDVTIFLEVLKNNWKNISLMKKKSQASTSLKSPMNINTSNNSTQSLENQSSSRSLSNANGNSSMRNTTTTIVSLLKVGQHNESAEAMQSQENPVQKEVFNQDSGRINTPEDGLNIKYTLTNLSEKESTNLSTLCGKTKTENETIVQVQDNSAQNNTSSCKKRRRWNRRNYCMFCKKLVTNFTRHIFRIHNKIEEVIKYKALLKIKDSKKERMEIFDELRLRSNSIYNKEVIKNSKLGNNIKDLLLTKGRAENGGSYVICSICKGVFRKPSFYKHKCFKNWPSKNQDKSDNNEAIGVKPFRITNFGFELAPNENDSFDNGSIYRMLQNNSDTQMAFNDALMLSVVHSHQRKQEKKKSKAFERYTFNKIKLGCSFLAKLKEKDCSIHQLLDCLVPSKKDIVCETIKSMCKFDETTGRIGISSMPSRLLVFMRDATSQALKDVLLDQLPSDEKKTAITQGTDEIMSVLQKLILSSKSQTETVENPPSEDTSTTGVNNDAVILLENVLPASVELTNSKTQGEISVTEDDSPNNGNIQGSIATNLGAKIISSKNNSTVVSEELPVKPLSKTMDSSKNNTTVVSEELPVKPLSKTMDSSINDTTVVSEELPVKPLSKTMDSSINDTTVVSEELPVKPLSKTMDSSINDTTVVSEELPVKPLSKTMDSSINDTTVVSEELPVKPLSKTMDSSINDTTVVSEELPVKPLSKTMDSSINDTTVVSEELPVKPLSKTMDSSINDTTVVSEELPVKPLSKTMDSSINDTTVVSEELPVKPLSKTMDSSEEPLSCDISLSTEENLVITTPPPNEDSSVKATDKPNSISFEQETVSENKCIYLGRTEAIQFSTEHNLSRIDNTLIEHKQYSNENLTDTIHSSLQNTSNKNSDSLKKREKRCYCIYCKKLVTNFSRHVKRKHNNEEKVIQINNLLENNSEDYRAELREIRSQGNHVHDKKLLTDLALQDSTKPTIFLNYRRAKKFNGKLKDLVICTFCKGIFSRNSFSKHIKNCYSKKKQDSKNKKNEHGSEVEIANSCKNESLDNNLFENKSIVHLNNLENKLPLENCNHQNAVIEQLSTKLSTENLVCSQGCLPEKVKHDLPKITQCPGRPPAMNTKHSTLRQPYPHSQLNKASAKSHCLYCQKSVPKFIQHVLARHRDKEPIIQYMALLKANSEENKTKRRKIITLLQLKNKKTYFRKYLLNRPSKNISLKFPNQRSLKLSNTRQNMIKEEGVPDVREDISECGNEGLIEKGKTSNSNVPINNGSHEITTTVSTKEKKKICFLREYASPLIPPPTLPQASTKLRELVLPRLRMDHASMVALNDTLLVATASRALERMYTKSKDNGFSSTTHLLRDGGKLLMCAQSLDKTITEFRDLLKSSKVNTVFEAAKEMCGLDEKTGSVKFINMPFRITYVINQAAAQSLEEVLNNTSLNENDKKLTKKDIDEFLELKRTKFRSLITRWPASKKPRKTSMTSESEEESNSRNFTANSTRTGRGAMNKRAESSSSESEENSFDESDKEDNPISKPGNEGKKSQRKNLTSDNCYNDSLPKEASFNSQKKRWTEKQKRIVILEFKDFIINGTNPGRKRCRELIASTEELSGRTADQVNLIIDNINKGKLKMPSEFKYLKRQST